MGSNPAITNKNIDIFIVFLVCPWRANVHLPQFAFIIPNIPLFIK